MRTCVPKPVARTFFFAVRPSATRTRPAEAPRASSDTPRGVFRVSSGPSSAYGGARGAASVDGAHRDAGARKTAAASSGAPGAGGGGCPTGVQPASRATAARRTKRTMAVSYTHRPRSAAVDLLAGEAADDRVLVVDSLARPDRGDDVP